MILGGGYRNHTSQFGEDKIVADIVDRIGVAHHRCGEVGAGDGIECSNTYTWWYNRGWDAVLAETDRGRYDRLTVVAAAAMTVDSTDARDRRPFVVTHLGTITPYNVNAVFHGRFDLLSIDVDGGDWHLVDALEHMPRILIVEWNPTVPWWVYVRPELPGGRFGASAYALVDLCQRRGLQLVAVTESNLVFVDASLWDDDTHWVDVMRTAPESDRWLTVLATNQDGRPRLIGPTPPWGLTVGIEQDDEPLVFRAN